MFLFYVFVKLNTVFCISLEKELERKTMAYLVKSVGYVAQWKLNVNNLDQNEPKRISNTFKIDMWQWRIMMSRSWGASNISLYPNYKIVGGLNPPIASFQIRVLDNIGKQSQILAMSGDLINYK